MKHDKHQAMKTILIKHTKQNIGLILLITILSVFTSCSSKDAVVDDSKREKAIVKINLMGGSAGQEVIKKGSNRNTDAVPQVQEKTIPFDHQHSITVRLSPAAPVSASPKAASGSKAATPQVEELTPGVMYKVVVYDNSGNYVQEKNFTYGTNDSEGFQLESNKNYTFVAYSVNSSSSVPPVNTSAGNTLDKAKIATITEDLMTFKKNMTVVSGNNNLDVVLKHRFSVIKTKLDATGIGNISNVNAEILPTNTSADYTFSTEALTYNGLATTGAPVSFPASELNKEIATSNETQLISDAVTNGELKINSLTIGGTTRNNILVKDLKITPGVKYNLDISFNGALKTMKILAVGYDGWNSLLFNNANGAYTSVARSKLDNLSNFGPSGTVRIAGFSYSFINVNTASDADFETAINDADIIWVGYVSNSYFSAGKRTTLAQKINEKKKFFFFANDNYNGTFFPGRSTLAGYTFDYLGYATYQVAAINGAGPNNGIFGNLPVGTTITHTLATGKITGYPADAVPFLRNPDATINAVAADNFVSVSDINWYINYAATDGFYNGTNRCNENANSILFCNIFEKAVNYRKSNP